MALWCREINNVRACSRVAGNDTANTLVIYYNKRKPSYIVSRIVN
jgi:hypothetical protein